MLDISLPTCPIRWEDEPAKEAADGATSVVDADH